MKDAFYYALEGLKHAYSEHPNVRRELLIAALALTLGLVCQLSPVEWVVLVLTIGLVFMAELANTALEAAVDLATITKHPKAKIAKDVAAGMVLLAVLVSVVVGFLLFVPKILKLIGSYQMS